MDKVVISQVDYRIKNEVIQWIIDVYTIDKNGGETNKKRFEAGYSHEAEKYSRDLSNKYNVPIEEQYI